ncbi:hypothetical protein OLX02_06220 [Novosphingobium sp. KCTC 2891]|nr:hypothetical protein [Novosphingobium sp. KCTC 2891]
MLRVDAALATTHAGRFAALFHLGNIRGHILCPKLDAIGAGCRIAVGLSNAILQSCKAGLCKLPSQYGEQADLCG